MRLKVIAEGVETQAQVDYLRAKMSISCKVTISAVHCLQKTLLSG
jgi:predicted signal transduction protein with EAL and GGDEF domain